MYASHLQAHTRNNKPAMANPKLKKFAKATDC